MVINKTYFNNTYVSCHILLSIFITIIIGGIELSGLDAVQLVMLTILSYLLYINFELFFRLKKEEYKRVITNNMKLFFNSNLNNLIREKYIFPWIISSAIIIIIITIIRCIFYIFRLYFGEINWESIFLYINNQPYLYIVIIVVVTQIVLITILLSKRSSNEIGYLLAYFLTLRIAFLLFLNIFFAYDINEIMFFINVYDILSRSDILGKISTSLQPNALIAVLDGLRINWYNQLNNYLISKYKSIYFNRIIPFQYRLLSESSCNKVSLVKPKLLGSGYYRSQFQPYTLPQVYVCPPFNVELIYNKISSSPTLTIISENDYIKLIKKYFSDISLWDDESIIGSSWDGDTVIGSEINLDLNVCNNEGAAAQVKAGSKLKDIQLKDPQLNFSSEYFHENRIQSVFVNKGKDRATNLDLTSDNEENSYFIVENIDLNQVASFLDEDVNRAKNESRQTHRYNLRSVESSSRGLYGQGNTTTSVTGLAPLEAQPTILEDESMVYQQIDLDNNQYISQEYTSQLPEGEVLDYPLDGIDGYLEKKRVVDLNESAQTVQELVDAQLDSEDTSSLSSHNSVEFEEIWDSDFAIQEFKSFLNSVTNEELFSNELYKEFLEDYHSLEEISSSVINDNVEKDPYDGMLHLSLEGLVSMSKNEISNLIKELGTNKPINTTSYDENKLNKTYKGNLYLYTRSKLYFAKRWFNQSLSNKKFEHLSNIQKEELTSNFTGEHDKLKDELKKNKNSHEFLNDLLVRIDNLVSKFINPSTTRIRREDKAILAKIKDLQNTNRKMKSAAKILIVKSNLDDKIKDILLKQVEEITTNINAGINIGNEIDHAYIDELGNKIQDIRGRLVKRSQLICNDTLSNIAKHQFRSSYFYPTTKNSLLIAEFHKCVRDEIIEQICARLSARVKRAAEKGGLIKDQKLVNQELISEFHHLRKNLYIIPNLQDACQHLIEVLVKLNNKYYYPSTMKYYYNKSNYFIYTKLKEIIIRFIKRDK